MSQQQLDYERPSAQPRTLMWLVLLFLRVSSAAIMLLTGAMFWYFLVIGILKTWEEPPPLNDLFDPFASCMYCATPFALGGILFVLCGFRLQVGGDPAAT